MSLSIRIVEYVLLIATFVFILGVIAVKAYSHTDKWEPEKPKLKLDPSLSAFKTYTKPKKDEA